ncbi:MAG: acetyltransferase [Burkholderiales bacterium]|nr:acetyltransferase [Burkholderiales bacterium]
MADQPIIIIGAGGHATVVADALLAEGLQVLGFVDRDAALTGGRRLGLPVLGGDDVLAAYSRVEVRLVNGIGGTGAGIVAGEAGLRERVQRRLEADGWHFGSVRHPDAVVSPHAQVEPGSQLMAGSVVQPGSRIGQGAIVNTRAVVEHDATVGAFAHIAPGAVLCGGVDVGEGAHVGAGAVVRQGVRIGAAAVIGVGAAVVRDCIGGVWAGVPARLVGGGT